MSKSSSRAFQQLEGLWSENPIEKVPGGERGATVNKKS